MKNKRELGGVKNSIGDFLRSLPEEVMLITGNHITNELFINGRKIDLQKSLKVRNHSPTGFNWGYGGSGPAQTPWQFYWNM